MPTATTTTSSPTTSTSATPSCTSAVPGKYGHVSDFDACNAYYFFNPSFAGNLAWAVIFGLSLTAHFAEAIIFKKKYCWVVMMGAAWETVAFVFKTLGAHDQQSVVYSIGGQLLFLLAPLWINAFVYMTIARMIYFFLPEKKMWGIRAVKLTVLFVWLDVACFLVQGAGGSLLSNNGEAKLTKIGLKVYVAGISVQLGFICIFFALTAHFYRKLVDIKGNDLGRTRWVIFALFAVMALIIMRISYRVAELTPGVKQSNAILTQESYPFFLDAFPMALALILLNIMHPGLVLKGPDSEFPKVSRAEKKALKQKKKEQKAEAKRQRKAAKNGLGDGNYMPLDHLAHSDEAHGEV